MTTTSTALFIFVCFAYSAHYLPYFVFGFPFGP